MGEIERDRRIAYLIKAAKSCIHTIFVRASETSGGLPRCDFSFSVYDREAKRDVYLQIGVGTYSYTLPFNKGNPVVAFFIFYEGKIYKTGLFIYKRPWGAFRGKQVDRSRFVPYKKTVAQTVTYAINNSMRRFYAPLGQFAKPGPVDSEVDKALIDLTMDAALVTKKLPRLEKLLGIKP